MIPGFDALKRNILLVHKEAFRLKKKQGLDLLGSVNPVIQLFNSTLGEAKSKVQVSSVISGMANIATMTNSFPTPQNITEATTKAEEVYIRIVQLMNSIDVDVSEQEEGPAPLVQLSITQQVSQFMNFSFEQLVEAIQQQKLENSIKQEAIDAVNSFHDEIEKPKPSPTKLKTYLDKVARVGKEFAIPLLVILLENWDKIFLMLPK
jgi:hypothetical protein